MTTRRGLVRTGRHQAGASAVEYAIIVAGMAVAIVAVLGGLQSSVRNAYVDASGQLAATAAPTSGGPATTAPATTPPATTPPATTPPATTPPATTPPATTPPATTPPATLTQPPGSTAVARGNAAAGKDIGWTNGAKSLVTSMNPPNQGTVALVNGVLVFTPSANATPGLVTVTWSFTKGNQNLSGTITYWVT